VGAVVDVHLTRESGSGRGGRELALTLRKTSGRRRGGERVDVDVKNVEAGEWVMLMWRRESLEDETEELTVKYRRLGEWVHIVGYHVFK